MNFLKYEAEKKTLQEQNLTPDEYEEEIKKLVKGLKKELKNEAIKQRMGKLKSY